MRVRFPLRATKKLSARSNVLLDLDSASLCTVVSRRSALTSAAHSCPCSYDKRAHAWHIDKLRIHVFVILVGFGYNPFHLKCHNSLNDKKVKPRAQKVSFGINPG